MLDVLPLNMRFALYCVVSFLQFIEKKRATGFASSQMNWRLTQIVFADANVSPPRVDGIGVCVEGWVGATVGVGVLDRVEVGVRVGVAWAISAPPDEQASRMVAETIKIEKEIRFNTEPPNY